MKHKLTDRQLMGLLAVYFSQRPSDEPRGTYGEGHEKAGQPYWVSRTNMGGAVRRMCDGLRDSGFLTDWDHYSLRDRPYYERGNQLTVKGYEALEERLGKLPKISPHWSGRLDSDFFNESVRAEDLAARKRQRADRETEIVRLQKEEQDRDRELRDQWRKEAAAKKLAKLRELFSGRGLADNWSDEDLLDFADKVASL